MKSIESAQKIYNPPRTDERPVILSLRLIANPDIWSYTHNQCLCTEKASRIGGLSVFSGLKSRMSFKEDVDFYYDENGLMVLTEAYLRRRGHCCHSDCRHCPYKGETSASDSPLELNLAKGEDPYEKYLELADQDCDDTKD